MIRTQIYITEAEQSSLKSLSLQSGKKQSALIREAIDRFITVNTKTDRLSLLRKARGLWKDRNDLPDFAEIRRSLERGL